MSGGTFFLDTSIILYLLNGDKNLGELRHQKQLFISVITALELLAFKGITKKEAKVITDFFLQ